MKLNFTFQDICNLIDTIQTCMDDYLYIYDFDDDIYHISNTATKRFLFQNNHFQNVNAALKEFVYYEDYPLLIEELQKIKGKIDVFHNLEYRWIEKSGNPIWINCRGKTIQLENGHIILFGSIIDISTIQKADPISGLLSVTSFQNILSSLQSDSTSGYLLRIGIDDFKQIIEKLGFDYGNMIIKETTNCIKSQLLDKQLLYRLIGDEFIIIDISGRTTKEAFEQYKKIRNSVDDFIARNHYEAVYTISAGILPINSNEQFSLSHYMKYTEFALQEAKRKGKNQAYIFYKNDYDAFVRKRDIGKALRQSVNHNFEGFSLYLQPMYNAKQKKISGAECLLRFTTPELGMVMPSEFIPVLESSGLIIPVGKWVLHKALSYCEEISKTYTGFKIGINVSAVQILKSNIISEIISSVQRYDIHPEQVTIELTESGNLCSDYIIKKMWNKLKAQGVNLCLDDFGTGYSNFHYIDEVHPQIIKIDRSFTVKASENEWFYHLLSLLSNMLHKLNIRFCLEGIENEEEFTKLQKLKPDIFQGYLWGKPCSYEEFIQKMNTEEFTSSLKEKIL